MSIFVNANKNLALTLVTNVQVFIVEFVFKEDQNSNIVVAILNNIQQLGCIFVDVILSERFLSKWLPKSL